MNQDPSQGPTPAPTPPTSSHQADKHTARTRALLVASGVTILISLGLIGFGMYTAMQANTKKDDPVVGSGDQKTEVSNTITTPLPNGKTATYADTAANKNISFSSSAKGPDYVDLSYKTVSEYIAAADKATVTKLCGVNGKLAAIDNIVVGTMSTSVRAIEYPTKGSCLDELASMRNADSAARTSASALIKQVDTDVRQFYKTVVIK